MPLTPNDYKLFEQLVSMTQPQLHKLMGIFLKEKYPKVVIDKNYIFAEGDIPVALVAHMDTVFKFPVFNLYYDPKKNVAFSPDGLGADDRAGVFAILQIIKADLRPSIILTTDEEKGGLGAAALAIDYSRCPIENIKYLIELDRQGSHDAVFYDCGTEDFKQYIQAFGFKEAKGSFSDISFLMSEWDICGVNLSIGYRDEHTYAETLHFDDLFETVRKVKGMLLKAKDAPTFNFELEITPLPVKIPQFYSGFEFGTECHKCKMSFNEYETIPVKTTDGFVRFYCPDCVTDNVAWCNVCSEAYEITPNGQTDICLDCLEEAQWTQEK